MTKDLSKSVRRPNDHACLMEYSGEHDISFLTSQANAEVQKIFCGLNLIVET